MKTYVSCVRTTAGYFLKISWTFIVSKRYNSQDLYFRFASSDATRSIIESYSGQELQQNILSIFPGQKRVFACNRYDCKHC